MHVCMYMCGTKNVISCVHGALLWFWMCQRMGVPSVWTACIHMTICICRYLAFASSRCICLCICCMVWSAYKRVHMHAHRCEPYCPKCIHLYLHAYVCAPPSRDWQLIASVRMCKYMATSAHPTCYAKPKSTCVRIVVYACISTYPCKLLFMF